MPEEESICAARLVPSRFVEARLRLFSGNEVRESVQALDTVRPLVSSACAGPDVCAGCEARVEGLCAPLEEGALADVAAAGERCTFAPRDPLFHQGDPATHVFVLHNGTARLTQLLPDGRQAAVGMRFGGDVLGFTTAPDHLMGAEALSNLTVCRIKRTELERLFAGHASLERHFLDLCVRELAMTQESLVALGRFTAEERVAAFLLSFVEARERRGHAGPVHELPATRADVGELLGLTLETVSRTVSAFRRRGWLRAPGPQTVELLNRAALEELASGSTHL